MSTRMCESKIVLDGAEHTREAAKVVVSGKTITVYDILGNHKVIEDAVIEEIDFLGHTVKITRK